MRIIPMLCLVLAVSGCGSKPPPAADAGAEADAGVDRFDAGESVAALQGPASTFSFAARSDATSQALTALARQLDTAPTSDAELQTWLQQGSQARAAIAADPEGSTDRALGELPRFQNDPSMAQTLFLLLAEAGMPRALRALHDAAVQPPMSDDGTPIELEARPSFSAMRVRRAAVDALARKAMRGQAEARNTILTVATEAPDEGVQRIAIGAFLQSTANRNQARTELLQRLPKSQHHLIFGSL